MQLWSFPFLESLCDEAFIIIHGPEGFPAFDSNKLPRHHVMPEGV